MTVLALTAGNGRAQFPLAKEWCEPQKTLRTPEHAPAATRPPRAGLTSPHQNVRWQNRKAAVCSCHLKVHLHTLPARLRQPTATSAKAVEVGYRDLCLDQHTCGFQLLHFFQTVYVWLHFFNFLNFFFISLDTTFHLSFYRSQRSANSRGWP